MFASYECLEGDGGPDGCEGSLFERGRSTSVGDVGTGSSALVLPCDCHVGWCGGACEDNGDGDRETEGDASGEGDGDGNGDGDGEGDAELSTESAKLRRL